MSTYDIPELFPQPKQIEQLEGMTELSVDVRLVTLNVFPLQRKSVRAILSDAGVRVVANKKTYVIEARIDPEDSFDFTDVPEGSRGDYYEITMTGSEIKIRAPHQRGSVLAACTLGGIFKQFIAGRQFPNLFIRDWPEFSIRGLMIDAVWGPDKMVLADWFRVIDQMALLKLNTLVLGIYNCLPELFLEGRGTRSEFFNYVMPSYDELKKKHQLNWYSVEKDFWNNEVYISTMSDKDDLLMEVINYAREKDMIVIPSFTFFGNNTLFPRMLPETAALAPNGKPVSHGFCTYTRDTRVFVTELVAGFMEKYFPNGAPYAHIRMDDVHEYCHCPKCSSIEHDELVSDYLVWLTKTMVARKVNTVIFWQDIAMHNPRALEAVFARKLFKAELKEHAVIHWREGSNTAVGKKSRVSLAKKTGLGSWVAPVIAEGAWELYRQKTPNIKLVTEAAVEDKASGIVAYDVFDPSHQDQVAYLAKLAWAGVKNDDIDASIDQWALSYFYGDTPKYMAAAKKLAAAASSEALQLCTYAQYSNREDNSYPGAALEQLEAMGQPEEELRQCITLAGEADAALQEMLAVEGRSETASSILKSLRAEAAKVRGLGEAFVWMLELRKEMEDGMVMKRMNTTALKAQEDFISQMKVIEHNKPSYAMPIVMQTMSRLLEFLEQLAEELKHRAGRKQAKQITWTLTGNE